MRKSFLLTAILTAMILTAAFGVVSLYAYSSDALVDDGVYTISDVKDTNYVIDIAGASTANKANVQLYRSNGTAAQKFIAQKNSNGTWSFVNYKSGLVFDLCAGKTAKGTNIWQYRYNGSAAQQWKLQKNSDGSYTIYSSKANMVVDVAAGRVVNGGNIQIWTPNGSAAQHFIFKKVASASQTSSVTPSGVNTSNTEIAAAVKVGSYDTTMAQQIINQVNAYRKSKGVAALKTDSQSMTNAQIRAYEITKVFDHVRPDGSKPISLKGLAGENIAEFQSSVAEVMNDWKNSAGHNRNMLDTSYTGIGVAVYKQLETITAGSAKVTLTNYYWVQVFTRN